MSAHVHPCVFQLVLALLLIISYPVIAETATNQETRSALGNSTPPVFIRSSPETSAGKEQVEITVLSESLDEGWVTTQACYGNIAALDHIAINYNNIGARNMVVVSSRNIGKSSLENGKLELDKIKNDAEICLRYDSKALESDEEGQVVLRTGPYMQPSHDAGVLNLALNVSYPCEDLHFISSNYSNQTGYEIDVADCEIRIAAEFKGKLMSELMFVRKYRKKR